jgi:4-amino-4-deoxy-L-arabinose transferase-like glycosyltransferase
MRPDRAVITALALASLLPFLGQTRDVATHELRHAEVAREMAETGYALVPTLLGREYDDKPPVLHLMVAALYRAGGGPSLALARVPSVVAATAGALALYGIGLVLAGRRVALLAAVLLLGTFEYHRMGQVARPDMVFTAAILGACLAATRAVAAVDRRERLARLALAGAAAGFATITKGPLGFGVPALFALILPAGRPDLRRLRLPDWTAFVAGGVVVVASWAAATWRVDHGGYLHRVLTQPDLTGADDAEPWFTYVPKLAVGLLPLTVLLPVLVRDVRRRGWTAAVATCAILLLALSAVPKKRAHYLLPVYPFIALAVADALQAEPRWSRRAAKGLVALSLAAGPAYFAMAAFGPLRSEEPKLVAGRRILALTEPGRPIVCTDELAEAIAFEGRRSGVAEVVEMPAVVSEAVRNGPGGYIAVGTQDVARLERQALGRLTLTDLTELALPAHHRMRGWRVYRVTSVAG